MSTKSYSYIDNWQQLPLASWYPYLNTSSTPLIISLTYFIVVKGYSQYLLKYPQKPSAVSFGFKAFTVVHNLLLMLFSLFTFVTLLPVLIQAVSNSNTLKQAYCDKSHMVWNNALFYTTWLFYLSKFYEFVDTFILLFKGKVPSFLQSYHHSGAVLGMYYLTNSASVGAWVFVLLNSFIHTVMYFYYFLTTLGYRPKFKKYITFMQISQFLIGYACAVPYFLYNDCITGYQKWAISFNILYVLPLIFLFAKFAIESYNLKGVKKE